MTTRTKAALAGALTGLGLLAATSLPALAQQTPADQPPAAPPTHEQLDQMMDAMHGDGSSQRMHEQMGGGDAAQGEQLMEQCVQMMAMMQQMQGMMGGAGGMSGMQGMGGMMGGQSDQSMPDMMGDSGQ